MRRIEQSIEGALLIVVLLLFGGFLGVAISLKRRKLIDILHVIAFSFIGALNAFIIHLLVKFIL